MQNPNDSLKYIEQEIRAMKNELSMKTDLLKNTMEDFMKLINETKHMGYCQGDAYIDNSKKSGNVEKSNKHNYKPFF